MGLGNPGKLYAGTRHNAGSRAADHLAEKLGSKMRPSRAPASVARGRDGEIPVLVAKPAAFMNESGPAVASVLRYYKVPRARLVVFHDDLDLSAAQLRVKFAGASGGHHGIESIEGALGSRDFYRVRIGIGRPTNARQDPSDFVLEPMGSRAAEELARAEKAAGEAALSLIRDGLDRTMNRFNTP